MSFDNWYSAYPRHVGKISARTAYDKVLKKGLATPEQLLEGAIKYAQERVGQDPQFTKHPATWLNAGCWDDDPKYSPSPAQEAPPPPPPGTPTDAELRARYEQQDQSRADNVVELRPKGTQIHQGFWPDKVSYAPAGVPRIQGLGKVFQSAPGGLPMGLQSPQDEPE